MAGWGSIGSSIFGSILRYKGTRDTNKANSAQALRQMQFQEKMAKSAHQNEVADLKKAGLNPILSGTGGSGAAAPSGASAKMLDVGEAAASGAQSLAQIANIKSQTDKIDSEKTLLDLQVPEAEVTAEIYDSMLGTGLKGKQLLGRTRNPWSASSLAQAQKVKNAKRWVKPTGPQPERWKPKSSSSWWKPSDRVKKASQKRAKQSQYKRYQHDKY